MLYRIIIIDDEKEISNGFAQFFPWEKLGYSVAGQFSSAKEALAFIKSNTVDIVVSDVVMPGMTGIDLAYELSLLELIPQPLIVLFSAYNTFKYAQQALEYGCSNYILKSAGYDELIANFTRLKEKLDAERCVHERTPEDDDKIIKTIKRYVSSELADANLDDAAAMVFMSASYVSRYFKQKTGMNFTDYVMKERMSLASELLLNLRYKIYDISAMVGYNNPFNFTRSFKKFYSITPKDFRFEKMGRVLPGDEVDGL